MELQPKPKTVRMLMWKVYLKSMESSTMMDSLPELRQGLFVMTLQTDLSNVPVVLPSPDLELPVKLVSLQVPQTSAPNPLALVGIQLTNSSQ